jgi:hypothetical protein
MSKKNRAPQDLGEGLIAQQEGNRIRVHDSMDLAPNGYTYSKTQIKALLIYARQCGFDLTGPLP